MCSIGYFLCCCHSQLFIESVFFSSFLSTRKYDNENDKLLLRLVICSRRKRRTDISINCKNSNNNKKKIGIFFPHSSSMQTNDPFIRMHLGNKSYNDIVQKQMNNMVSLLVNK